jgi:3-hydroxyisobutyrate dehydrogenase-like beta-hydroxyacid dehydrogenase
MEVGFIGLGHAGGSMATNLLRAGHTMDVYSEENRF